MIEDAEHTTAFARSIARRRARRAVAWIVMAGAVLGAAQATAACPPAGWRVPELQALRDRRFEIADDRRDALALGLVDCLADPRPRIREGIAYEALYAWTRAGKLAPATLNALYDRLLPMLDAAPDRAGFRQPFAALALAEVARADRIEPCLDARRRDRLVDAAARYLRGVRDHRGFDDEDGWRHGVAHGADLLLQLAMNPRLQRAQLDAILAAVAAQVAPPGHFYVYGESERLARPVWAVAQRNLLGADDWQRWFAALARPQPFADWDAAAASQLGLAKRHDTHAFLFACYAFIASDGDAPARERALPAIKAALRAAS